MKIYYAFRIFLGSCSHIHSKTERFTSNLKSYTIRSWIWQLLPLRQFSLTIVQMVSPHAFSSKICPTKDALDSWLFICLQTIERILISFCVMWIYGLQAQTKSNSERFLRLLSCCRHYAVTAWILRHLKLFDRFFTCDVTRFMQWLYWIAQCLQQLKNLSELLLAFACRP